MPMPWFNDGVETGEVNHQINKEEHKDSVMDVLKLTEGLI
jgi:hypothetical protein